MVALVWWNRRLLANVNGGSLPTAGIIFRHPDACLLVADCGDLHIPESCLSASQEFSLTTSDEGEAACLYQETRIL